MTSRPQAIYLDANATTQVLPQAAQAAMLAMQDMYGNPSSSHITGLQAKALMEDTRKAAKQCLGSGNGRLVFTSGATEGIQTAILSALVAARNQGGAAGGLLLYGATEHKAVPESLKHWNQVLGLNAEVMAIPVDKEGRLDLAFIADKAADALMICTMAVNNETGVFQDLKALEHAIRSHNPGVFWMVDCVQALGKIDLDLAHTSIDYAPFSGHKLYAPKGIGMLYIRESAPFTPFIAGGGQEGGLRSGTENLPAMAALKVVLDMLNGKGDTQFADKATLSAYRLRLIAALEQAFGRIVLNHSLENSVPTTLNFAVPGFSSKEIMDLFDAANIRVSSGSACSSKVTGSFVLDAMGLPRWQSESAIRLSFGPAMTEAQLVEACAAIKAAAGALQHSCLLSAESSDSNLTKAPLQGLLQLKSDGACCWLYVEPGSRATVIVDPLPELMDRLLQIVNCQQLPVVAVLDTHGHGDHQSCRTALCQALGLEFDCDHLGWPQDKGASLPLGDASLIRLDTPGHTADSRAYLLKDGGGAQQFAFVGDTVLPGSLGRSNFACSDTGLLYDSLKQLHSTLGETSVLLSSHDYHNDFFTNFAAEIQQNPLLAGLLAGRISREEFILRKDNLDSRLEDQVGEVLMCGAYDQCQQAQSVVEYRGQNLDDLLARDPEALLLDIREPHEYQLSHRQERCINVPLSRLAGFVAENAADYDRMLILICRSGSRSLVAARALKRLGYHNVAHVNGGYALG
ncbi:aminotransferase class V-fold PLP-dependent enzyme [Shewanella cyperi]|uniref:aminotransferase class V-fold PLP-dependent enzyme n=1 Tax=Shewanella cyperi TaxID=2814292 RepID=UPI001A93FED6|nr:aminotransferase class V-fold PLP-dependent enzyme [Shewanella cyperi]QSX39513.1 aminotransferase class V-fold PLP-dependent enzyme [Shewanella cyperi]